MHTDTNPNQFEDFSDEAERRLLEEIEWLDRAAGRTLGPHPPRPPAPPPPARTLTLHELVTLHAQAHPATRWGRGEFRRFEGGPWRRLDREELQRELLAVAAQAGMPGLAPGSRLVRGVMEYLRVTQGLPDEAWRLEPHWLPLENGLLNLETGQLRAYTANDRALNALPCLYEPQARAPVWEAFLQSRVPEAAGFLQEFAGLALTPEMRHETSLWLVGPDGAGKSTFLYGLIILLGARSGVLSLRDLLDGRFNPARVANKTLMLCMEQGWETIADASQFNAFVTGEHVNVRVKYRPKELVVPKAKLAWAFSSLPRVLEGNNSLFRRVAVVKFPALPPEQRDPSLKSRLIDEADGMLNWALAGLKRLTERGRLALPPCVVDATDAFRLSSDLPAQFLAECCERQAGQRAAAGLLYDAYANWCQANGHRCPTQNQAALDWDRLGFERIRHNGRAFWRGLRLKGLVPTTPTPTNETEV